MRHAGRCSVALGGLLVLACGGTASAHELRLTIAGGVAIPKCGGPGASCAGTLRQGPSLEAMGALQLTRAVGMGLLARAWRVPWEASYQPQMGGPAGTLQSTLTTLFLGAAVRATPLPDATVEPLLTAAAGVALQWQTGNNFACNGPVMPTGQIGAGGSTWLQNRLALFVMVTASIGLQLQGCAVSDGPPVTAVGAWGFGLQAGLAFDFGAAEPTPPPGP